MVIYPAYHGDISLLTWRITSVTMMISPRYHGFFLRLTVTMITSYHGDLFQRVAMAIFPGYYGDLPWLPWGFMLFTV